ncbi:MAG: transglycosylase domain-containing protein [Mogibacterium sp.]|nr:transglycosylase domain-containing protein [Mogibacterium sp.]
MRSDKDKRTETEKEIDDFLSKFESPADKTSADFSKYLEPEETGEPKENVAPEETVGPEETGVPEAPSFVWKDVAPDDALDEFFASGKRSEGSGSGPEVMNDADEKQEAEERPVEASEEKPKKTSEETPEEKSEEPESKETPAPKIKVDRKKRRKKYHKKTSPAAEPEVKNEVENGPEAKEAEPAAVVTESEATEAPKDNIKEEVKKEPAAYYKSERKKRRNKDYRNISSVSTSEVEDADAAGSDIEDVVSAALVPGAGAEMSGNKAGRKKKRSRSKKENAPREVIRDTGSSEKDAIKEEDGDLKDDSSSTAEGEVKKDSSVTRFKRKKIDVKRPGKKIKQSVIFRKTSAIARKIKKRKGDRTLGEFLFLKPNPDYDPSKGEKYEKDGRTVKNKKYRLSFLKVLGNLAAVFMVFVLAGMIYAIACIASAPKYDYKDIYAVVDTASVVYDDHGEPIDNVFYTENRKVIGYKDMPEDLVNSFIAIEDKTFWKHHGFNWTRMIGAIISSLTGHGQISGTSTITQQLARNVYLADTKSVRSIKRKLLEMYYAGRLEHNLSKEQIVEAYLNTIYLGHGCYGVNAAARTYFSKDVKDLDLIECAALAALPQSPDTYALLKLQSEAQDAVDPKVIATEPDTIVTNDVSKGRRQLTLDLMLEQGMISQADHDKIYDLSLNDFIDPTISNTGSAYSYFHEYLVDTIINDLVEQHGMTYENAERTVYTRGLQIYSTLDSTAQKVIVDEFQDDSNFPYVDPPRDEDGNMLNSEGEVAMYDYNNDFDEDGNFRLSGENGDVSVNGDGSVTINKGKKLHIYETETNDGTDYSIEFRSYYLYDDEDVLYSISGGYVNIPMGYKSLDSGGNVVVSADYFSDPAYSGNVQIDGGDVIFKPGSYSLSTKSRQPQAAMTIVGVGTGEVKAMVGGRTSGGQKLLNRSLNPRQPGSSIKPLAVYGAALQKSFELQKDGKKWKFTDFGIDEQGTKGWGDYLTCHSSVEDERCKIEGRYWPNNFSNSFTGKNNFITAIQHSINTCAVKILLQVGSDYSVAQLKRFGISTVQDDTSNPVNDVNPAALALGAMTEGVEPLEMALAYASFPGGGKLNTPVCYYKVLDRNGEVLLEGKSEQSEALNEGVAWIMTDVLQSVVSSNGYMYVEGVSPGGKTGTTNDEYDIWFDGFTPAYAGALWIGTDENVDMNTTSTPAARLWGNIMNQIPAAKEGEYRDQPSNVIYTSGCYFTDGTETGLAYWSGAEERKKAEEAKRKAREEAKKKAYNAWLKEREKHKIWIDDQYEDVVVVDKEAWTETTTEIIGYEQMQDPAYPDDPTKTVDDPSRPIYRTIDHPAETHTEKKLVKKGHWEYEPGYRDGDFKYSG